MPDFSHLMGWKKDPPKQMEAFCATLPMPLFADNNQNIKGTSNGKTTLLYEFARKVNNGKDILSVQVGTDCVAHGSAGALGHALAADICLRGDFDEWCGTFATEPIYGGSRVNVGGGRLGNSPGSFGSWGADFCQRFAIIPRGKYGKYDLTEYNWTTAEYWGRSGVGCPVDLLNANKGKRIKTVSQVRTFQEVADCIANGIAVTIASNCGFNSVRDKNGACRPAQNWAHQMHICGQINTNELQMVCIANSWPPYLSGPRFLDCPDGAFWCYADDLEKYILSANDSWAYSDVVDFERKELNLRIV